MSNFNNPFFNSTFKYSNFTLSLEEAKTYLHYFLNNQQYLNEYLYNLIDYEKLFYIEIFYQNNEDIQYLIRELKEIIANNWLKKQQLLKRIT